MKKGRDTYLYQHLSLGLAAALFVAVIAYLYFLNQSVIHVVSARQATFAAQELESEIAKLETNLIDAQHHIVVRMTELERFQRTVEKRYVERSAETRVVRRD